jgi:hypothetical protein
VTQPVVEPAGHPAVVIDGARAGGSGLDVVDMAIAGRFVAELVEALPVPDLDRPAGGPGEHAPAQADVSDAVGPVDHDPLHPRLAEPGQRRPGGYDAASAGSQIRPAKLS